MLLENNEERSARALEAQGLFSCYCSIKLGTNEAA